MHRPTLILLLALKAAGIALAACGWWPTALVLFFGPDLWICYHLFVPSAQGISPNFTSFETARPEIWLTIDDGPDPVDTPQILNLLDRHQARATFFLIGARARQHPDLVREIVRRGHEVGHHTQTHPAGSFWCASPTRLRAELDQGLASLAPHAVPRWFRPPVGIKHLLLASALSARGLRYVGWSLRSGDCLARSVEAVERKVLGRVRPGTILLMHEGPSVPPHVRVTALTRVLEGLSARRYRCVIPEPAQLR